MKLAYWFHTHLHPLVREFSQIRGVYHLYVYYQINPYGEDVGDCVIRALTKITGNSWDDVYIDLAILGFIVKDMPSSNKIYGKYLRDRGFKRYIIPNTCPDCYTVKDFCEDHPDGEYILATGSHVVAVVAGDYYDSWDSGNEVPIFYFKGER